MIHPIELHSTQAVWVVSCNGPCSQIGAELRTFFGDADLYANEDEQPTIATMGYNCPTCSMCEAVDGDQDDECPNMSITGERHVLNVTILQHFSQSIYQFLSDGGGVLELLQHASSALWQQRKFRYIRPSNHPTTNDDA